eukprot:scaffold72396_cov41-Cyclotella_meneghiniana.AAC.3
MAFHDLTKNKIAPPSAKALLGLGSKFIVTPETTTACLHKSFERIRRDFSISVFFASGNDDYLDMDDYEYDQYKSRSKLYIKSKWKPNEQRRAASNLLPYQKELLELLLNDPELIFPETDKGLGPCAVTYDQYVEACLKHLRNTECYDILTEEEARQGIEELEILLFGLAGGEV